MSGTYCQRLGLRLEPLHRGRQVVRRLVLDKELTVAHQVCRNIHIDLELHRLRCECALTSRSRYRPDARVKQSMNAMETAKRTRVAQQTKAEADKYVLIQAAQVRARRIANLSLSNAECGVLWSPAPECVLENCHR
jgi:hypothetical protein